MENQVKWGRKKVTWLTTTYSDDIYRTFAICRRPSVCLFVVCRL